ncbi:MAG: hypothetical protein AAFX50_17230, partial [Acidobacteriota bacterium]
MERQAQGAAVGVTGAGVLQEREQDPSQGLGEPAPLPVVRGPRGPRRVQGPHPPGEVPAAERTARRLATVPPTPHPPPHVAA